MGPVQPDPVLVSLIREAAAATRRYDRDNAADALDEAVDRWEVVVAHPALTSAAADVRFDACGSAGNARFQRYWARGEEHDLARAQEHYAAALALGPTGDDLARWLTNSGNALQSRFDLDGNPADLREAARQFRDAVAAAPSAGRLTNLGMALLALARETGDDSYLEGGLAALEEAVRMTSGEGADASLFLNNLGLGWLDRFDRAGDIQDLGRAVDAFERSVQATPQTSPWLQSRVQNLATSLVRRYETARDPADLDRGIELIEAAVALAAPGSPERANGLNNLGGALLERYDATATFEELLEASRVLEEAVAATPPDSPLRPTRLANLANSLHAVFLETKLTDVLDRAIELHGAAADLSRATSRDRAGYLNGLASGLQLRFERLHSDADRAASVEAFREACISGLEAEPRSALIAARNWARWADEREAWAEAAEAYGYALSALNLLFRAQLLRRDKEVRLADIQGLPVQAAWAYAQANDPVGAVVALEQGRALLLSEALERDRADLQRLGEDAGPELVERYAAAAARVNQAERTELEGPRAPRSGAGAGAARALRESRAQLEAAVQAIREVDGYESFLKPADIDDVFEGAAGEPLVYLAAAENTGFALVVRDAEAAVECHVLPRLTAQTVRERAGRARTALAGARDRWPDELDELSAWMWDAAMGPLLDALGTAPRANVVAAGLLGLLPLHAAWTVEAAAATGRRYALDSVVLSFAPNARALTAARRAAQAATCERLVAVDQPLPQPAGVQPLPNSTLEVEAAAVAFTPSCVLRHEQAIAADVLRALPGAGVIHLSCHGRAEVHEPLQSFLLMSGGAPLTLAQLMGARLGARLAVLSACETGLQGETLPDEAISLATGLLQSGAAGVVASLWAVPEDATMLLMVRFYQLWRGPHGHEPVEALRSAQQWVRDTTNGEKAQALARYRRKENAPLASRAADVLWRDLVLRPPHDREHQHPANWAAFCSIGA